MVTNRIRDESGEPVSLICAECGAIMTVMASSTRPRCLVCDSARLSPQPVLANLPEGAAMIPFEMTETQVVALYQQWLGARFFRPHDLSGIAADHLRAIYLPAWSYHGTVQSTWVVDSIGDAGEAASGQHTATYANVLISAARGLPADWISRLGGFDLGPSRPVTAGLPRGRAVEAPAPEDAAALAAARDQIAARERAACVAAVPAAAPATVQVRTMITDLGSALLFLPVWIASFRYQDRLYRCLINGQTGMRNGEAPVSGLKIAIVFAAVVLAIIIVLAITQLYSG